VYGPIEDDDFARQAVQEIRADDSIDGTSFLTSVIASEDRPRSAAAWAELGLRQLRIEDELRAMSADAGAKLLTREIRRAQRQRSSRVLAGNPMHRRAEGALIQWLLGLLDRMGGPPAIDALRAIAADGAIEDRYRLSAQERLDRKGALREPFEFIAPSA